MNAERLQFLMGRLRQAFWERGKMRGRASIKVTLGWLSSQEFAAPHEIVGN